MVLEFTECINSLLSLDHSQSNKLFSTGLSPFEHRVTRIIDHICILEFGLELACNRG